MAFVSSNSSFLRSSLSPFSSFLSFYPLRVRVLQFVATYRGIWRSTCPHCRDMGQVLAAVQEKLHGRQWKEKQIRKMADKVFDRFRDDSGKDHLNFEDLYIAVLCIYNDINKHLPGSHNDPPSKAKVKDMMMEYDVNLDSLLDREEFAEFIQKLTADTLTVVSRNLIIALVVAPTVALVTKRATEGVPGVGKVVQRIPNSIYASIVTLGVVLVQNSSEECE